MSFPKEAGRWLGEDCAFHDADTENNCHYSMFVQRKCVEGECPDLGQYPSTGATTMTDRVVHAVTGGREGRWTGRDEKID